MCFQIDLRAETPVVPLRLRNLEAVTGEEDEGPSEGLVKPWGRFTEVRFNLFRTLQTLPWRGVCCVQHLGTNYSQEVADHGRVRQP